jgi:hypothetical protein
MGGTCDTMRQIATRSVNSLAFQGIPLHRGLRV